jgi:uncharacterized protein with gpF-like domain
MAQRPSKRRPIILPPFRGVGSLRRQCEALMAKTLEEMRQQVEAALREEGASPRTVSERLDHLLGYWRNRFDQLGETLARRLLEGSSTPSERRKFFDAAAKAMGVSALEVYSTPQMQAALDNAAVAAATFIKRIPPEYIGKVAAAMVNAAQERPLPGNVTLARYVQDLGFHTKKQARLLVRDQWHKVTSTVQETQHRSIGGTQYIWRTARDERVVGNPTGLYPHWNRQHGDHYARDGKVYSWDKPPADGHPGNPIGCRCFAQCLIDVEAILGRK